jgi:hypothetical protein
MRLLALLLLVLYGVSAWPGRAHAGPGSWPAAPPPLRQEAPPALPRPPLDERRPVEVGVFGLGLHPLCAGGGTAACAPGTAWGAGVAGLHRTSPYFAFGPRAALARTTPGDAGPPRTELELELALRVYLLEEGTLDPYLELGLGYALARTGRSGASSGSVERAYGPSGTTSVGLDAVLWQGLRVGLLLGYREVLLLGSIPCLGGVCAPGLSDRLRSSLVLGAGLTLGFGRPL